MLGRRGGFSPPASINVVAGDSGLSRHWSWVGVLNVTTAFLIQMAYAVVAGWVLYYFFLAIDKFFINNSALLFNRSVFSEIPEISFFKLLLLLSASLVN